MTLENIFFRLFSKITKSLEDQYELDPEEKVLINLQNNFATINKQIIKNEYYYVKDNIKKALRIIHSNDLNKQILSDILYELISENLKNEL